MTPSLDFVRDFSFCNSAPQFLDSLKFFSVLFATNQFFPEHFPLTYGTLPCAPRSNQVLFRYSSFKLPHPRLKVPQVHFLFSKFPPSTVVSNALPQCNGHYHLFSLLEPFPRFLPLTTKTHSTKFQVHVMATPQFSYELAITTIRMHFKKSQNSLAEKTIICFYSSRSASWLQLC